MMDKYLIFDYLKIPVFMKVGFMLQVVKLIICHPKLHYDALHDLVSIVQFKKREIHPWRSITFSNRLVACNFTKSNTPPWVFFTFFKLYKWYQITQNITYVQNTQEKSALIPAGSFRDRHIKRRLFPGSIQLLLHEIIKKES